MKLPIRNLISQQKAQVSIEFIILTGSVIVGAIVIFTLQGTIKNFANVTSSFVETERNITITKLTR